MLVIQRLLNIQVQAHEEQRHTVFQTRCTMQGKVCDLIIDSGSCTMVSSTIVEKLKLPTTPAHPYNLTMAEWGQRGKINWASRYIILYWQVHQDEVLCNVVPVNASHLLGRPWQFDRKTHHDGFKNTYSFSKDGKNILLAPLSPSQIHEGQIEQEAVKFLKTHQEAADNSEHGCQMKEIQKEPCKGQHAR